MKRIIVTFVVFALPIVLIAQLAPVNDAHAGTPRAASVAGEQLTTTPVISSVSPLKGRPGTVATINGTGFSTTPASNIVYFGGMRAVVAAATATSLQVTVPYGATYAPVSVLVSGLTAYSPYAFMPTFDGSPGDQDLSFSEYSGLAPGHHYRWGAVADLDVDGRLDLIEPNDNSTVSIVWNNSSPGALGPEAFLGFQSVDVGPRPYAVRTADLNGDGKQDIAAIANSGSSVTILKNVGGQQSMAFERQDINAVGAPQGLAIGDLDRDGKPDVLVSGYSIRVLRNIGTEGSIAFTPAIDLPGGYMHITLADIDGDQKQDVIAALREPTGSVSVFKNISTPGTIQFAYVVDFATGVAPMGIAAGDMDGDGKPDVVVTLGAGASGAPKRISVFRNVSIPDSISFAAPMDLPDLVNGAWEVELADLNGDGRLDIAAPVDHGAASMVSVFCNTSSGGILSFAPRVDIPTLGEGTYELSIGDLDRDGRPDLTVASLYNNTYGMAVHRNLTTAQSNAVAVTLPVRTVHPGTSVEIPVNVGDLTGRGVISYQFTVACDTPQAIVAIQNALITAGTLSAREGWTVAANTDSAGRITVGAFGATALTGSGPLVILTGLIDSNAADGQATGLTFSSFLFNAGEPLAETADGRLTVSDFQCGDVDANGSVQAFDAALTLRDAIGIAPLPPQGKLNADVDLNGQVQAFDAALILRRSIGLPPPGGVATCFIPMGKEAGDVPMPPVLTASLTAAGRRGERSVVRLRLSDQDATGILALTMTIALPSAKAGDWTVRPVDLPVEYVCAMHHPDAATWVIGLIDPSGIRLKDLTLEIEVSQPSLVRDITIPSVIVNATQLGGPDLADAAGHVLPREFALVSSYPNPFNPSTTIVFDVPAAAPVTIEVYDVLGVLVRSLVDRVMEHGRHEIVWDGTNDAGRVVSTGQYFCKMKAGEYLGALRLMMLK